VPLWISKITYIRGPPYSCANDTRTSPVIQQNVGLFEILTIYPRHIHNSCFSNQLPNNDFPIKSQTQLNINFPTKLLSQSNCSSTNNWCNHWPICHEFSMKKLSTHLFFIVLIIFSFVVYLKRPTNINIVSCYVVYLRRFFLLLATLARLYIHMIR
jgi:hypothetical protein